MSANISDGDRSRITATSLRRAAACTDPADRRELLDRAVVANLPVARAVALWYRDRGVAHDDLEQVARLALVAAAQRFDPDRGHDFLSYAVPTMRGAVRRYFRDHGWTVRPPRLVQELQVRALDAAAALQDSSGGEPDADAIARALGEPREAVAEALAARGCFSPASLDRPFGEDGVPLADLLPADEAEGLEAAEARVALRPVVRALSERERRVLYLRFFEQRSQQEIADRLGTSQMHVSRLLRRILDNLRDCLGGTTDEDTGEASLRRRSLPAVGSGAGSRAVPACSSTPRVPSGAGSTDPGDPPAQGGRHG